MLIIIKKSIILFILQMLCLVTALYLCKFLVKEIHSDVFNTSTKTLTYILGGVLGIVVFYCNKKIYESLFITSFLYYIPFLVIFLVGVYLLWHHYNLTDENLKAILSDIIKIANNNAILFITLIASTSISHIIEFVISWLRINKYNNDNDKTKCNRNPISNQSEDLLNRSRDVKNFYTLLNSYRTIGIIGYWGVGKTSFINLLKSHKSNKDNDVIKDSRDFIFVDYNLYHQEHIAGKDREYNHLYILTLFLQTKLKENRISSSRKIITLFRELAHYSSLLSFVKNRFGLEFNDDILRDSKTINLEIRKELESLLKQKKIAIIYDDLDRLTDKSKIFELLKLIDILNDIKSPNIVQIVAYDNEKLLHYMCAGSAEEKEKEINEEFINRMIDYKFILRDAIQYPLRELLNSENESNLKKLHTSYDTDKAFEDIANKVRSMKMRQIRAFNDYIYEAIQSITHYKEEIPQQSTEDNVNNTNTDINDQSGNNKRQIEVIKIELIKSSPLEIPLQQGEQYLSKFIDINILRLTQLMKTFSLSEYEEARDIFHYDKETSENFKEYGQKFLSFQNQEIFNTLRSFFNHIKNIDKNGLEMYKLSVSYNFPELLDAKLELIEKIIKEFRKVLPKISDDLRDEILNKNHDNIFDNIRIADENNQGSNTNITWKDFKEESILSMGMKCLEDFSAECENITKSNLKTKIDAVYWEAPRIHRFFNRSEKFRKNIKQERKRNPYKICFYALFLKVGTPHKKVEIYKEYQDWFPTTLYETIINNKDDTDKITERLRQKDSGVFLYFVLISFLDQFTLDNSKENINQLQAKLDELVEPLDKKLATCMERLKEQDLIRILVDFAFCENLITTPWIPRDLNETEENYKTKLNNIIQTPHYQINHLKKFKEICKLFNNNWQKIENYDCDENNKILKSVYPNFNGNQAKLGLEILKNFLIGEEDKDK